MLLLSVDASMSEFLRAIVLKKVIFKKILILVLKWEDDWISFSVLWIRSFHITGPLMEIENLHLRILICGFLWFLLEKCVGYEWEGCSNFSRNDDRAVLFCV